MNKKHKISRRGFLTTTASTLAAPYIIPSTVLGKNTVAPSERITLGIVGVKGVGSYNSKVFLRYPDAKIIALCDVDSKVLDTRVGEINEKAGNKDCAKYRDFREMIARDDIDAVCIATPDHWHALICIAAAEAGKDIYCQKPITHTFAEGQAVVQAVKKNGVIFQVGSQQRSRADFRQACELVLNGHIGKVKHIEVGLPTGHMSATDAYAGHKTHHITEQTPPAHLDYNAWCGPSPKLPYIPARVHFHWRWHSAFGAGQLMDWIGHHNDIAHWSLGRDYSGPVEVQAMNFTFPDKDSIYDTAVDYEVWSKYDDGVSISCANKYPNGTKWIGEDGWIFCARSKFTASQTSWTKPDYDPGPKKLYHSPEHHRNFLDGVKSRQPCVCPAEVGHRSITPGHLGLLSQALGGREIHWDPVTETVLNDPEASLLLKRVDYRTPWALH